MFNQVFLAIFVCPTLSPARAGRSLGDPLLCAAIGRLPHCLRSWLLFGLKIAQLFIAHQGKPNRLQNSLVQGRPCPPNAPGRGGGCHFGPAGNAGRRLVIAPSATG
jgi:hypothetical protein